MDEPVENQHVTDGIGRDEHVARFNETLELEAMLPEGRRGFDPWVLENTKDQAYSRDKFYTETVRQKRHGGNPKHVQVPFEEGDYQIISQIIQQRLVPAYKTQQDLIRDAVHHRIHDLTHGNYEDGLKIYLKDRDFERYDRQRRVAVRIEMLRKAAKEEAEAIRNFGEGLKQAADNLDLQRVHELLLAAEELLEIGGLGDHSYKTVNELIAGYTDWLNRMNRSNRQERITATHYNPPMPPMP